MSYLTKPTKRGFSLLEMTLAVGVSGIMLSGLWQMSGMADRNLQANFLATHAMTVAVAGQNYLTANKTAVLALVPAIGNVARIKVVTADASGNTPSLQAAGLLPANFVNSNSYGQSYAFYALREDSGTLGSADSGDRLVGLVITTGGTAIDDKVGSALAAKVGAAGAVSLCRQQPGLANGSDHGERRGGRLEP
jgi:prepilin-type N-terminal cleavage/methylation domain-containing protein